MAHRHTYPSDRRRASARAYRAQIYTRGRRGTRRTAPAPSANSRTTARARAHAHRRPLAIQDKRCHTREHTHTSTPWVHALCCTSYKCIYFAWYFCIVCRGTAFAATATRDDFLAVCVALPTAPLAARTHTELSRDLGGSRARPHTWMRQLHATSSYIARSIIACSL